MSTHLTAGQRARLQTDLEERRQRLANQLAEHLHGQTRAERARDVMEQDGDDAPQRAPEREVAAALSEHEQREIDAVDAALARLRGVAYGRCAECEEDIPFDRLQAEPWALRCLDCEARHERVRT